MPYFKISSWSLLLMISCSTAGAAQQTHTDPAYASQHCEEYYACIDSRPLSEAEARSSRGYPASPPPQAEIAFRDPGASGETRPKARPAPVDLSTRTAF